MGYRIGRSKTNDTLAYSGCFSGFATYCRYTERIFMLGAGTNVGSRRRYY